MSLVELGRRIASPVSRNLDRLLRQHRTESYFEQAVWALQEPVRVAGSLEIAEQLRPWRLLDRD